MADSQQYWTDTAEELLRATAHRSGIDLDPTNRDGLAQLASLIAQDTTFPDRYQEGQEIVRRAGFHQISGSFEEVYPYQEPAIRTIIVKEALELLREYPQRCSVCQRSRPIIEQRGSLRFCASCWPFVERDYRKGERKA